MILFFVLYMLIKLYNGIKTQHCAIINATLQINIYLCHEANTKTIE